MSRIALGGADKGPYLHFEVDRVADEEAAVWRGVLQAAFGDVTKDVFFRLSGLPSDPLGRIRVSARTDNTTLAPAIEGVLGDRYRAAAELRAALAPMLK